MGIEHSQNYLHSKQLVATLLSKSNICNDDIIIEIGPGKGIITIELAKKSKQVIAIEFDAKLAKTLSEKYKESKKVQIIEMDFLKYKISVKEPYKVCANIPFNITAYFSATASNQPQRRGLFVVVPYSCPNSLIWSPISLSSSVIKGPLPTFEE